MEGEEEEEEKQLLIRFIQTKLFSFFTLRSTFFILSLPFTVRFRSTELFELEKKEGKQK